MQSGIVKPFGFSYSPAPVAERRGELEDEDQYARAYSRRRLTDMTRIAGLRAAVAAGVLVAGTIATAGSAFAGAAGETEVTETPAAAPVAETTVEATVERKFFPSIAVGPAIGYADRSDNGGDFGWAIHVLARLHQYAGIQLEYFSLGNATQDAGGGHFDGLYVGVMPMFPIGGYRLNLFGQIGAGFSEAGNGVTGGGGVFYDVPIAFLNENAVDLLLRLDYKYFHIEDDTTGQHLIVGGFMLAFRKTK